MSKMQKRKGEIGKILIVDDSLADRQVLESMLTGEGHDVRSASTGQTALLFAGEDPPDLIVLDVRLSDIDGFEVCRRLKADERTRAIPVIFISGLEDSRSKIKGFSEGAVDYIPKPYCLEEVSTRVRTHLGFYRLKHHLERASEARTTETDRVNRQLSVVNISLRREIEQKGQAEQMLKDRLQFERLLSDMSARLINLSDDEVVPVIETALQRILDFFQVDRCAIVKVSLKNSSWLVTHAAYAPKITPVPRNIDFPLAQFPWVFERIFRSREIVTFKTRDDLPVEAAIDKQTYESLEILSSVNIPIHFGEPFYIISINAVREECEWPADIMPRLRILGECIAGTLVRQEARQQLEQQMMLKELLSHMSARFIHLSAENVDREIEEGLRGFVNFFNFDRAILAQFSADKTSFIVTHRWVKPDVPAPPSEIAQSAIPWVIGQVMRGEPVVIQNVFNLPEDAGRDQAFLEGLGFQAGIFLPLTISENCMGFLVFSDLRSKRAWPAEMAGTLQMAADVMANALERMRVEKAFTRHLHEIKRLKQQIENENLYLREEIQLQETHRSIISESKAMRSILVQVERVARTDSTVLIQGETGTGKELIAHAIHNLSDRSKRPLVSVNCASLSPTLIESELFGREKGAYTGALTRMAGRFEVADNSTLFLDEIGELPLEIQAKLLRVLEQGQFERLGSTRTIYVNVRIIAATNRDLSQEAAEGKFRKDLFYRLNVFPITIPPLRERPDDIAPMVWAFVRHYRNSLGKQIDHIPVRSMNALKQYPWPGNARELRNIVEHSMIISRGKALEVVLPQAGRVEKQVGVNLAEVERGHILSVLEKCGWRITGSHGAAAVLGLKRTTLQSKMKKLGIKRPSK